MIGPNDAILVFIHGAQNDHSVWAWHSSRFAAQGYRVLTPDLPGHGDSKDAPLGSVEAMADWLAATLASVDAGATRFVLIGHSMGSLVALESAARVSASKSIRIAGLVLLGTAVPMKVSPVLLEQALSDEAGAMSQINLWSHSPAAAGEIMAGSLAMMARQSRGVLHTDLAACNTYLHGLEAAAFIHCPSLIIVGGQDKMTAPKFVGRLQAALPAIRLHSIANGSHSMLAEAPNEVLTAISQFLADAANEVPS